MGDKNNERIQCSPGEVQQVKRNEEQSPKLDS